MKDERPYSYFLFFFFTCFHANPRLHERERERVRERERGRMVENEKKKGVRSQMFH